MLYTSAADWTNARDKRVLLFGMSGLGKTHVSNILRDGGDWFHYSVDYRIGTRYMGEFIADNFKREAMKNPFLAALLRSDSIYVASNITFNNLAPLSTYLGKPGDPALGGIAFDEYMNRQDQHRLAEIAALEDTHRFIDRARELYGYTNFVCDTSGSICEVVDPFDPADPLMNALARDHLLVWIRGTEDHREELVRRFRRAPKPMYYRADAMADRWEGYMAETGAKPDAVNPDDFAVWAYGRALADRAPRYEAMAKGWGLTVEAEDIARIRTAGDFDALVSRLLDARGAA